MSDGNAIKKLLARVYIRRRGVQRLFFQPPRIAGISKPCLSFIRPRHRAILSGFVYFFLLSSLPLSLSLFTSFYFLSRSIYNSRFAFVAAIEHTVSLRVATLLTFGHYFLFHLFLFFFLILQLIAIDIS